MICLDKRFPNVIWSHHINLFGRCYLLRVVIMTIFLKFVKHLPGGRAHLLAAEKTNDDGAPAPFYELIKCCGHNELNRAAIYLSAVL